MVTITTYLAFHASYPDLHPRLYELGPINPFVIPALGGVRRVRGSIYSHRCIDKCR